MPGWIRESIWLGGLVALLVVCALLAFFKLPAIVVTPDDLLDKIPAPQGFENATRPTAVDLVEARNGVRTAAVALIAGIGAALATGFAGRTYYLSRRGQLRDHYKTAVEQLAANEPALQVSAIGELERLAAASPDRHRQVMGDLATFLRSHKRTGEDADTAPAPAAVQAAFAAIARRRRRYDRDLVIDLAGADLRQVHFEGAKMQKALLRDAKLSGAFLRHSNLRRADLKNAWAPGIRLDHAELGDAILEGAHLHGATLDSATARRAAFKDVQLLDTSMRSTDLRKATDLPRTKDGGVDGATITPGKTKLPR